MYQWGLTRWGYLGHNDDQDNIIKIVINNIDVTYEPTNYYSDGDRTPLFLQNKTITGHSLGIEGGDWKDQIWVNIVKILVTIIVPI